MMPIFTTGPTARGAFPRTCGRVPGRGDAEHALEVPGEVGLVVEARLGGDRARRYAGQQQFTGHFHAPPGQVQVRRDGEPPGEDTDQVGWVGVQQLSFTAVQAVDAVITIVGAVLAVTERTREKAPLPVAAGPRRGSAVGGDDHR
jgi:hypothetical protein